MRSTLGVSVAVAVTVALHGTSSAAAQEPAPALRLERVTTAVPWPRGLAFLDDGRLIVLARGRHRRSGGVDASVEDRAGCLFVVEPALAEPFVAGRAPSPAVADNAALLAAPSAPPFHPWDRVTPPAADTRMDRPYCTLAWDAASQNLFVCAYSGVDRADGRFRKNATDALLRYDLRTSRWHVVEQHRPDAVPAAALTDVVSSAYYPHHDPAAAAPPHGWLNGPDGCAVAGDVLYAVAKDNSLLVRYDLRALRDDPGAPPPASQVVLGDTVDLGGQATHVEGHSAVAAREGWLYVGFRTTSQVIRLRLDAAGDVVRPIAAELVAQFAPRDATSGRSDDLVDLAFGPDGTLYVATARLGRVWRVGRPEPARPFVARERAPWLDLRALTGDASATCGNITVDARGRVYVCAGGYDGGGVVYRVSEVE